MPLAPQLLEQALRTPETADVTATPIVRAVILTDPANATDLVGVLPQQDSLAARNARRILCEFGPEAVPFLLTALASGTSLRARTEGIGTLPAMLAMEDARSVRRRLVDSTDALRTLLDDTRATPNDFPTETEIDFKGRVCDLVYVVVRELLDRAYDQSRFRGGTDEERSTEIRQWLGRGLVSRFS